MLTAGLIIGGLILLAILVGRRLRYMGEGFEEVPPKPTSHGYPTSGTYSEPPEHAGVAPEGYGYSVCTKCYTGFTYETVGTWEETSSQGKTVLQNVRQRVCNHCDYRERID